MARGKENKALMQQHHYEGFEPFIRLLIRAIHGFHIFTIESCEGHLEDGKKSFPHIFLGISPDSSSVVSPLLKEIAKWNAHHPDTPWLVVPGDWEQHKPRGYALELRPQNRNEKKDPEHLRKLQLSAASLGRFLLSHTTQKAHH